MLKVIKKKKVPNTQKAVAGRGAGAVAEGQGRRRGRYGA